MKGGPGVCHLCITPTVLAGVLPQFRPSPWRGGHSELEASPKELVFFCALRAQNDRFVFGARNRVWTYTKARGTRWGEGPAGGSAWHLARAWYTTSAVPPVWPSSHNK